MDRVKRERLLLQRKEKRKIRCSATTPISAVTTKTTVLKHHNDDGS